MYGVHITITIRARLEHVFAFISDHERFLRGPGMSCHLSKEGKDHRNGVGAVREIRAPGSIFTEEIVEFDPPRRFAYVVRTVAGPVALLAPVHDRGWMEFSADGETTRVDWHSRFRTPIPFAGWALERLAGAGMRRVFTRVLESANAHFDVVRRD
jgi:hypothetical protein